MAWPTSLSLIVLVTFLTLSCDLPKPSQSKTTEPSSPSRADVSLSAHLEFPADKVPEIDWGPTPKKDIYARTSLFNQQAPSIFVEEWLTGKPNIEGKFVLVDFWATWCSPCRSCIRDLNELARQFEDSLVVIGLSNETRDEVLAMTEPIIHYYSAIDTQSRTKNTIGIRGIPHVLLIDPSGRVCWQGVPTMSGCELDGFVVRECIERYRTAATTNSMPTTK